MTTQDTTGKRTVLGLVAVVVLVSSAFGGVLGYVLPVYRGLEEVTLLAITFTVSPLTFAAYGGVAIGTFLVTLLLTVEAISRFDDEAV